MNRNAIGYYSNSEAVYKDSFSAKKKYFLLFTHILNQSSNQQLL